MAAAMSHAPTPDTTPEVHWVVRMNRRNRTLSFAVLCLLVGLHIAPWQPAPWAWALLGLQFLVYPHAVYRRALRSRDQLAAEFGHMRLDAFCFGLWSAALGFPLWIAFLLAIGPGINLAAFEGGRGVARAAALHALGMLVALPGAGLRFLPDTSLAVSLLCIFGLSSYLLLYGLSAHQRTQTLQRVREKLHENEVALKAQLEEIRLLQTQLREEVDRDHLTGLYNRRYLAATIDREFARCARDGMPLALMMVDIDHFKQINDRHGHPFGDTVLVAVARVLGGALRAGDIACRYGGEEFMLLLPNMPLAAARERAEAIRRRVAGLELSAGSLSVPVRISAGVAEAPQDATDAESLIRQADAALYRAKAQGRDRVEVSA